MVRKGKRSGTAISSHLIFFKCGETNSAENSLTDQKVHADEKYWKTHRDKANVSFASSQIVAEDKIKRTEPTPK